MVHGPSVDQEEKRITKSSSVILQDFAFKTVLQPSSLMQYPCVFITIKPSVLPCERIKTTVFDCFLRSFFKGDSIATLYR